MVQIYTTYDSMSNIYFGFILDKRQFIDGACHPCARICCNFPPIVIYSTGSKAIDNTHQPGGITMSLTKTNLITKLNEHAGLSRKDSASAVESTFDIIKSELGSGNDVKISGLGKWTVKAKKERKGRNPQTGKSMAITARKVATFKTSLVLKKEMNS
jgi:integration host factor subunit alpha